MWSMYLTNTLLFVHPPSFSVSPVTPASAAGATAANTLSIIFFFFFCCCCVVLFSVRLLSSSSSCFFSSSSSLSRSLGRTEAELAAATFFEPSLFVFGLPAAAGALDLALFPLPSHPHGLQGKRAMAVRYFRHAAFDQPSGLAGRLQLQKAGIAIFTSSAGESWR